MTTEHKPRAYFSLPYLDVSSITVSKQDDYVHVSFGCDITLWVNDAERARELAAAFTRAAELLEPAAPVQVTADAVAAEPCPVELRLYPDRFPCKLTRGHDGDHAYGEREPWPDEDDEPEPACVICGASGVRLVSLEYEPGHKCFNRAQCGERKAQRAGAAAL